MPRPDRTALPWAALAVLLALAPASAPAQPADAAAFVLKRQMSAEEAHQAVAVDANYVYAITNRAIGKYDKETGERVGGWSGAEEGPITHLNSGVVIGDTLYCAHSNYPGVPMVGSIEMWDTDTMQHVGSHSFGVYEGSVAWVDVHEGSWWVAFVHYGRRVDGSGAGGAVGGKGPDWSTLVEFGPDWERRQGFVFPTDVVDRVRPYSFSGGAWGPDGHLYVTGHDGTTVYELGLPEAGSQLRFLAVHDFPGEGQGIAWDPERPGFSTAFGEAPTRSS
ncbi:MAG: hypothetical protein ABEL97_09610 [Salinibacter sp.]